MTPSEEVQFTLPNDASSESDDPYKGRDPDRPLHADFKPVIPATPPLQTLADSEGATPVSTSVADSVAKKKRLGEYQHRPPVYKGESMGSDGAGAGLAGEITHQSTAPTAPGKSSENFWLSSGTTITGNASSPGLTSSAMQSPKVGESSAELKLCQSNQKEQDILKIEVKSTQPLQGDKDIATMNTQGQQHIEELVSQGPQDDPLKEPVDPPWDSNRLNENHALEVCRDIRALPDSTGCGYGIRSGSRVAFVGDTRFNANDDSHRDTFRLMPGSLFLVLQLYSDLWASCIKLALHNNVVPTSSTKCYPPQYDTMTYPVSNDVVGFLPLCSVTLDVNYVDYSARRGLASCPPDPAYGHPVRAPRRNESLAASNHFATNAGGVLVPLKFLDQLTYCKMEAGENFKTITKEAKHLKGDPFGSFRGNKPEDIQEGSSGSKPKTSRVKSFVRGIIPKRQKERGSIVWREE